MTVVPEELRALDDAGIPYRIRKPATELERDIELSAADLERATDALHAAGWRRVHSPDPRHAFFVEVRDGRWTKLDAKLGGVRGRGRTLPTLRRRAPIVAFVGPDGAGKSTVVAQVAALIPFGVRAPYLGGRGGGGSPRPRAAAPKSSVRETIGVVRDVARASRLLAREHFASARGAIVLCDRHPKEILAVRPPRPRLAAALERLLVRALPWPDALVVLEAPPGVLHARKPEHPLERLEGWLRSYRDELGPRGAQFLDTTAPTEETVRAASELVWRAVEERMGL
ncbi:MAG TPA: hypothetical protein VHH36_07975, partial [Candidatus Thermoplasmatota archaeon]|nr:hypothetical protein [Candidatus Thermoplasmatota archaeon]